MMVVVDASVAAMWFLPEEQSHHAALLLAPDYDLAAPDILRMEVASALLKALRRNEITAPEAVEALDTLSAAALRLFPAGDHLQTAFHIARRHGGSLYDAIYVALARALRAPIVSNDVQMAEVAKASGVRAILIAEGPPQPASRG